MTSDDTYTVSFRLLNGAEGVMQGSCAACGPFLSLTKVTGSTGSLWLEAGEVWGDNGAGPRRVPFDPDLAPVAPDPPPAALLRTAYDMWHSTGIDLQPYTRLYQAFANRIVGTPQASDAEAATFADGLAAQMVMDAVQRSSHERAWVHVGRWVGVGGRPARGGG